MLGLEKKLTQEEFEKILNDNQLVLVDFFASWCGPCKMFAPIIEELSQKYKNSIKTLKLDIDENQDISDKYSINSVPTLILFKNTKPVERNSGLIPLSQCENLINKHLN